MDKLLDIVFRMAGAVSFIAFYIALGVFVYVIFVTSRSPKLSGEEKKKYSITLLKRNWIFVPLFVFGNYVMMYHFIPGATPDPYRWLFTALVEVPTFTLIIVAIVLLLRRLIRGTN